MKEKLDFKIKYQQKVRYYNKISAQSYASNYLISNADVEGSGSVRSGMGDFALMILVIFRCLFFLRKSFNNSLYGATSSSHI
jgi:hypothetical protein